MAFPVLLVLMLRVGTQLACVTTQSVVTRVERSIFQSNQIQNNEFTLQVPCNVDSMLAHSYFFRRKK